MAGTQAPKGFALAFVFIGIPLILWSAAGSNKQMAALETSEARQAKCIENTASVDISPELRKDLCRCVVREAERQGITGRYGSYDKDRLRPVVDKCYAIHA